MVPFSVPGFYVYICIIYVQVRPNQSIFRMWMDVLIPQEDPFSEKNASPV